MSYLTPPSRSAMDKCHRDIDKLLDDTIQEFTAYEQALKLQAQLPMLKSKLMAGTNGNRIQEETI